MNFAPLGAVICSLRNPRAQHCGNDALPLRRRDPLWRQARQPRAGPRPSHPGGAKCRGATVAEGNSAGLVKQHGVDIAGGLYRAPTLGDDVGAQRTVHASDTDGSEQRADRGRNQADQQGHQSRYVGAQALQRRAAARDTTSYTAHVLGHWPERHDHD